MLLQTAETGFGTPPMVAIPLVANWSHQVTPCAPIPPQSNCQTSETAAAQFSKNQKQKHLKRLTATAVSWFLFPLSAETKLEPMSCRHVGVSGAVVVPLRVRRVRLLPLLLPLKKKTLQ
jgi:hypothetical protein